MSEPLITDEQRLKGAVNRFGRAIPTYDDGYGLLFVHRGTHGLTGIVRAQTWIDAYHICEDEFFPETAETVEELRKKYNFHRTHRKVIATHELVPFNGIMAYEKYAELSDYTDNGKLPEGRFLRWDTIDTPCEDEDGWTSNELFCEGYGFRPNGPNASDVLKHNIFVRDPNETLDPLTPALLKELEITL